MVVFLWLKISSGPKRTQPASDSSLSLKSSKEGIKWNLNTRTPALQLKWHKNMHIFSEKICIYLYVTWMAYTLWMIIHAGIKVGIIKRGPCPYLRYKIWGLYTLWNGLWNISDLRQFLFIYNVLFPRQCRLYCLVIFQQNSQSHLMLCCSCLLSSACSWYVDWIYATAIDSSCLRCS